MKKALLYFAVLLMILAFAYAGWKAGRWFNYRISYESMVKQTVRDMVKMEALK